MREQLDALALTVDADAARDPERLVREFALTVPVLSELDARVIERKDTETSFEDRFGPVEAEPGWIATVAMPFSGDARFFRVRPERFTPRLLYATITSDVLRVTIVRGDQDEAALRRDWQGVMADVAAALAHLRDDVRPFNEALPAQVRVLLARARR